MYILNSQDWYLYVYTHSHIVKKSYKFTIVERDDNCIYLQQNCH